VMPDPNAVVSFSSSGGIEPATRSGENSPKLLPLAAAAVVALAHATGSSLSPFATPWAPASTVAAGPSTSVEDKGKAVIVPGCARRRRHPRHDRRRFMVDARRQAPPRASRVRSP
jgi:hypothetical protein